MEKNKKQQIDKIVPIIEMYRNDKKMTSHMIALEVIKIQQTESKNLVKADVISSVCKTCGHPFNDDVCCGDCIDKQTD